MKKDEKIKLSNSIKYDIEYGTYEQYPLIKKRLNYISDKLFKAGFISNSEELSSFELNFLKEQGYYE